ncbi:MAG: DUF815 domain-containing protein, partial [Clostridiales bacterium]|nr:DUF815 domain-containing protein [Clostridiales bacterium]
MTSYKHLRVQARSLTIFYRVAEDPVVESLLALLDAEDAPAEVRLQKYSAFTRNLFEKEENLSRYIWELTALDENIYVRKHARKEETSAVLEDCVAKELQLLQQLSQVSAAEVKAGLEDFLPEWITEDMDFSGLYKERMDNLFAMGWGIYARHRMFTYDEGEIVPVAFPDPIELKALVGYQFARNQVVENTEAFLRNKPAANVLLYGDAGTGKSSTIKAIVNKLWHQGLRMIEIRKGDMLELPKLIHRLADNPLKFILFIDDLSFTGHNEDVGALKAILEGSVAAKTDNVLIYATSNRRHLVKETLSDRSGDDVHRSETMEEQTSLSDRFGLSIPFSKPDK